MPLWLLNIIPMVWRFFKHWGIYILITLVLVGGPYLLYRVGYNKGYKARNCPPTYTVSAGGVVNNYTDLDYKVAGMRVKLLWLKLQFGY